MTDDKRKRDSEQPVEHRGYWERLWEATHPREAEAARERQRRVELVRAAPPRGRRGRQGAADGDRQARVDGIGGDAMGDSRKAWVLWWRYGDGSGSGIERVYDNETRANEDYALASKTQDVLEWHLDQVPFFTTGIVMR